jgi:beta-1,4-mannosyl-glycoprotein beta-1,4-N-acetylglucosaminyltransferase
MIIDCFTFFNELDLLELRLEELDEVVDKFVLVEATRTQSLLPKPLYFEENKERYKKFLHKIIHVVVSDEIDNSQNLWSMENFQRNCITRGLNKFKLQDNDLVLISDLDEIPRADIIKKINASNIDVCSLNMVFSAYFINLIASNRNWIGTICARAKYFKVYLPQDFRNNKDYIQPLISDAGWHFSWLGGYEKIYEKAQSCIEPFDKSQIPSKEDMDKYFKDFLKSEDKFFIHTENLSKKEIPFNRIKIDNTFPEFIINNQHKLSGVIL